MSEENQIEPVKTRLFHWGSADQPFQLSCGSSLPGFTLAYEVHGELNAAKDNAILLFHAFSGSHHAAGWTPALDFPHDPALKLRWTAEMETGWWDGFIGPGKALDTDKFCIVCANFIGSCYGSTGPTTLHPDDGRPWGSRFPELSVLDVVKSQVLLLDSLGIDRLHAVVGPSIGGLMALSLATHYPERVGIVVPIAAGFKTTILNRLILFEQILAIENDPHFHGGDYYGMQAPEYGLALARMISHKTFFHLDTIERRARRDIVQSPDQLAWYRVRDPFQSYMLHQGKKFVQRFDANTYLRLVDMWAGFDPLSDAGVDDPAALFWPSREAGQHFLVFSIDSDFCFYPEEQAELVGHLRAGGLSPMHITVHSEKGHDSFLLEPKLYTPHLVYALNQLH